MLSCAAEQFYSPSYLIRTLKTSIRLSLSFSNQLANGGDGRWGEERGKKQTVKRWWNRSDANITRLNPGFVWFSSSSPTKLGQRGEEETGQKEEWACPPPPPPPPPRRGLRLNGGKPPSISKASSIFTLAVEGCGWSKERVLLLIQTLKSTAVCRFAAS